MGPKILVVANTDEAARVAGWLEELGPVRRGDGGDETLAVAQAEAPDVVVLSAGLDAGDALAFARAVRPAEAALPRLILIGEERGPIRTALDAVDFAADRFLRRPLSRAALIYAVRAVAPSPAASLDGQLAVRLEAATRDAIESFLHERMELLAMTASLAHESPPAPHPWREPTQILDAPVPAGPAPAGSAPPSAPEEASTGTFVSELRRTMNEIEARLFGEGVDGHDGRFDEGAPDIDLDSIGEIGVHTLAGVGDAGELAELEVEPPARPGTPPPRSRPGVALDLREEDVAQIIGRLQRDSFTGEVDFEQGAAKKTLLFEEGRLVFAASAVSDDHMGDLLLREGKITREQLARARQVVDETGRRMGEILVEMGFLKRRELLPAVRRHLEDIVYSLFGWNAGTARIVLGDGAPGEKIRLTTHPAALIVEGIRRKQALHRLQARLLPTTVLVPLRAGAATPDSLAEAELSPDERAVVRLFDGRRDLAEVVAAAAVNETAVYQLAWAFIATGGARPLERGRDASEPGRVTTGVSAPASVITGTADIAIDRERVLAKHAHVREADYFTVLGVRRDATAYEIRRAFDFARKDYAPESFSLEVQREHAGELREIGVVLDEAFRVLSDEEVRSSYLAHLEE